MTFRVQFLLPVYALLVLITGAVAQPKPPLPTLTSEDVIGTKPAVAPASPAGKEIGKPQPEKTPAKDEAASAQAAETPQKKAEKEWNERLKKAQEKLSELARHADQTELQITPLRNQLFSATARGPEINGQLNTRIGELTEQRNRLRTEVQTAQQDVARLQSEGQGNSYQVAAVSLTNEKGAPDAQAYQAEHDKLQTEIRDAQARIEVLQIRLNSVQGEVLKKGNGDNFALNRLRQERDRTTTELEETRSRIEELKSKVQSHRQKATTAGVPLQ